MFVEFTLKQSRTYDDRNLFLVRVSTFDAYDYQARCIKCHVIPYYMTPSKS